MATLKMLRFVAFPPNSFKCFSHTLQHTHNTRYHAWHIAKLWCFKGIFMNKTTLLLTTLLGAFINNAHTTTDAFHAAGGNDVDAVLSTSAYSYQNTPFCYFPNNPFKATRHDKASDSFFIQTLSLELEPEAEEGATSRRRWLKTNFFQLAAAKNQESGESSLLMLARKDNNSFYYNTIDSLGNWPRTFSKDRTISAAALRDSSMYRLITGSLLRMINNLCYEIMSEIYTAAGSAEETTLTICGAPYALGYFDDTRGETTHPVPVILNAGPRIMRPSIKTSRIAPLYASAVLEKKAEEEKQAWLVFYLMKDLVSILDNPLDNLALKRQSTAGSWLKSRPKNRSSKLHEIIYAAKAALE